MGFHLAEETNEEQRLVVRIGITLSGNSGVRYHQFIFEGGSDQTVGLVAQPIFRSPDEGPDPLQAMPDVLTYPRSDIPAVSGTPEPIVLDASISFADGC